MSSRRRVATLLGALALIASTVPALQAAKALPDLKVTSLSLTAAPGTEGFNASDRTKNVGDKAAAESKTLFYLSRDEERGNDYKIKSRKIGRLTPGDADSRTTFLEPGEKAPDGDYYVIACADGKRAVTESNERNNCFTSEQKIEVSTEPGEEPPDPGVPPASFSGAIEAYQTRTGQVAYTERQNTTLAYEVVRYRPNDSSNAGDAVYRLTSASIQYTLQGRDENGCEFSTSGTLTPPFDATTELTLDKRGAEDFYYEAFFGDGTKVPLNQCGRAEWELDPFWDTGRQPDGSFVAHFMTADRHLRGGSDKNLAGTVISSWHWDLAGEGEAKPVGR